ncbi:MAG: TIGR01244 family sulfur transferase [Rhodomicrobiaceae bacterium]
MVQIVRIDEKTYVAGQVWPEDMPELARQGIRLIVNNRPDGEAGDGQPRAAELEAAAREHGVAFANLPFATPALTPDYAAQFAQILKAEQGPVLAFCRTGNRSSMLWAAANIALGQSLDAVLEKTGEAGYDLSPAASFIHDLGQMAAAKTAQKP